MVVTDEELAAIDTYMHAECCPEMPQVVEALRAEREARKKADEELVAHRLAGRLMEKRAEKAEAARDRQIRDVLRLQEHLRAMEERAKKAEMDVGVSWGIERAQKRATDEALQRAVLAEARAKRFSNLMGDVLGSMGRVNARADYVEALVRDGYDATNPGAYASHFGKPHGADECRVCSFRQKVRGAGIMGGKPDEKSPGIIVSGLVRMQVESMLPVSCAECGVEYKDADDLLARRPHVGDKGKDGYDLVDKVCWDRYAEKRKERKV